MRSRNLVLILAALAMVVALARLLFRGPIRGIRDRRRRRKLRRSRRRSRQRSRKAEKQAEKQEPAKKMTDEAKSKQVAPKKGVEAGRWKVANNWSSPPKKERSSSLSRR